MDPTIQLQRRYGVRHDYTLLSDQQQALLLDKKIKDNTDAGNFPTVDVRGIERRSDGTTLLDLFDTHRWAFRRNDKGGSGPYSRRRIAEYLEVLGTVEDHQPLGDKKHLFDLGNNGQIRVLYNSIKDRV